MATAQTRASKPGTVMQDGSIYAGALADGKQVYAAPQDAKDAQGQSLTVTFNGAAAYASKLNKQNYLGHNDWRVPNREELRLLAANRSEGALRNTFNASGNFPGGYYWSSTEVGSMYARDIRLQDGYEELDAKMQRYALRCVRG